jgi:hypothetical protein
MKYVFDPTQYGFLPAKKLPEAAKKHLHKKCFFKVIATDADSFWYSACHLIAPGDERWAFDSGVYTKHNGSHTRMVDYCGCITSPEFAESLLIHLFGTTTNEGTLKYGKERLEAKSLPIPRRREPKPHTAL